MLSTPPAFILSQDQTLMFNVDPSSRSTSFFILVITVLIKNVRWFFLKSSEKFIRIFKVVLLFSCQRSFLIRFLRVRSFVILSQFFLFVKNFLIYFVVLNSFVLQQLLYHIISDLVCQELFNDIYFTLFWSFSVSNFYIISFYILLVKNFFIYDMSHFVVF